jgi:GNAT superfamily N-acetyltransferase
VGEVHVRAAVPEDVEPCGPIMFEAFKRIAEQGSFPLYHPTVELARRFIAGRIGNPGFFGVVAEIDGAVVGSNFIDERGPVQGIGPITVAPAAQGRGVGRRLMEAVLDHSRGARSIRLLQDAHNPISLALYASLGFDVKDITVQVAGEPAGAAPADGAEVRGLRESDLDDCARLHERVHGYERTRELRDALEAPALTPVACVRDGRVTAYASTFSPWQAAHGVAESEDDMRALIAGATAVCDGPLAFLLPVRQAGLFRWCLGAGLRPVRPMTYMVIGEYDEPAGPWFPSVLY